MLSNLVDTTVGMTASGCEYCDEGQSRRALARTAFAEMERGIAIDTARNTR